MSGELEYSEYLCKSDDPDHQKYLYLKQMVSHFVRTDYREIYANAKQPALVTLWHLTVLHVHDGQIYLTLLCFVRTYILDRILCGHVYLTVLCAVIYI